MAKTDVKSAFRIIPIHPADNPLLGIRWNNVYYFDQALAMGLSCYCAIFESFSTALEWVSLNHLDASAVLHILDDFLFVAKTKEQCARDLQNSIFVCDYLGVPLLPEKTVGPDTVLQFAGITPDSLLFEARLPEDKLVRDVQLHAIWPELWETFNITFLELFPIVLAVHVWGSLMAYKRIIFFSDNPASIF